MPGPRPIMYFFHSESEPGEIDQSFGTSEAFMYWGSIPFQALPAPSEAGMVTLRLGIWLKTLPGGPATIRVRSKEPPTGPTIVTPAGGSTPTGPVLLELEVANAGEWVFAEAEITAPEAGTPFFLTGQATTLSATVGMAELAIIGEGEPDPELTGWPLPLALGGPPPTGGRPWIVNMHPAPEQFDVRLLKPISFSIRDTETFVDPASMHVAAGYSRVYGRGNKFFDRDIPNTKRAGLTEPLTNREPILSLIPNPPPNEAVRIKQVGNDPERSVYFTRVKVDDVRAYRNIMISTLIKPVSVPDEPSDPPYDYFGPVFGLELGPRNTCAMVFFRMIDGVRHIFLTGPMNQFDVLPQHVIEYDWSVNQRYTLFWNETRGLVQLFANNDILIASVPLSEFPTFDLTAPKHVEPDEYTLVYGIEGDANDEVEISAVSLADDVGFPLVGNINPDHYTTIRRTADLVKTTPGMDPRRDPVSPWFEDKGVHFGVPDEKGLLRQGQNGFQMARVTKTSTSLAIYREEPGFLLSNAEGYSVDVQLHATSSARDGDATGMGFVISDGFSVFKIALLQNGSTRYLGLKLLAGSNTDLTGYNTVAYDWTVPGAIRFVVDGRSSRIRIYRHPDVYSPLLDLPLDRTSYPTPATFGWSTFIPFLAVGHYEPVQATGSLYLREVRASHIYQTWEAGDGLAPNDNALSLPWTKTGTGSAPNSPIEDYLEVECDRTQTLTYTRAASTNAFRGATVEARVAITGNDQFESTGDAVVLDDGLRRFILGFTETEEGKFAALALRAGVNDYQELAGFDGDRRLLSFRIDWTKPHTYRIERRAGEGVFVFVDNESRPRIFWPENKLAQLPDTLSGDPSLAFGHFHTSCPSNARWYFVRGFFSTGFEVSFKRNRPDLELKDKLFATEAIVLVEATDVVVTPPPVGGDCSDPPFEGADVDTWNPAPALDVPTQFVAATLTNVGGAFRAVFITSGSPVDAYEIGAGPAATKVSMANPFNPVNFGMTNHGACTLPDCRIFLYGTLQFLGGES